MIYPTIAELTKGEFNRYQLTLATAKCARKITNEYVRQRDAAEKAMTGNKDTDKPLMNMIDREYRDEKAVKIAIATPMTRLMVLWLSEREGTKAVMALLIDSEILFA